MSSIPLVPQVREHGARQLHWPEDRQHTVLARTNELCATMISKPASFGQWLQQRRKACDLTQHDLAERAGCAYETVRKIEAGTRRPSRQLTELFAQALGVPAEEIPTVVEFARAYENDSTLRLEGSGTLSPASRPRHPGNLPAQRTSLVGRTHEIAAVRRLLLDDLDDNVRMVTLHGPPGIGKTRLGLQVAATLREHFADGVFVVYLAPVADPDMVAPTICRALGVKEVAQEHAAITLERYLQDKEVLLLLDNFERVVPARSLLDQLLETCPDLKVLVTSRAALRVYGEHQFEVPPLSVPDPSVSLRPEDLEQYDATKLFIERSRADNFNFAPTRGNTRAIVEICRLLDGVPHAIELAAARCRVLSPQAILSLLGERFSLLSAGEFDVPAQQQTLRRAIDWSYDSLNEDEQAFFRRASVFVGSCMLEAFEAVCGPVSHSPGVQGNGHIVPGRGVVDQVTGLLDKSLLRRSETPDGSARFSMLWTVREYAREKLVESGEQDRFQRRHAEYYLKLVEEAEPKLTSGERYPYLERLDAEMHNLRTALDWCLSSFGDAEIGLRIAGALHWFWYFRGLLSEGRAWLEKALSVAGALRDSAAGAKVLDAAGRLALLQDDYATMYLRLEESVALWRQLGEKRGLAYALTDLGIAMIYRSRSAGTDGQQMLRDALRLLEEVGDKWGLAFALDIMADATLLMGGSEREAIRYREESLKLYRKLGDRWGTSSQLIELGHAALRQGDYEKARARLEDGLAMQREIGDRWIIAHSVRSLGDIAWYEGEYVLAAAYYQESLTLSRELGDKLRESFALRNLGHLACDHGDYDKAEALFRQSLELAYELGNVQNASLCFAGLAGVATFKGQTERSAMLFGMSEALREDSRGILPPTDLARYNRNLAALRTLIDEGAFESAWQSGRSYSITEAFAYVNDEVLVHNGAKSWGST